MTALLTDPYQLTMLQAYLEEEMTATAVVKLIELVPALRRDGIAPAGVRIDSDGVARRKRSEGKATWPGIKQVVRQLGADGRIERDVVQLDDEPRRGEALLCPCMRGGWRVSSSPTLQESRAYHVHQISLLPDAVRTLQPASTPVGVDISPASRALAQQLNAAPH